MKTPDIKLTKDLEVLGESDCIFVGLTSKSLSNLGKTKAFQVMQLENIKGLEGLIKKRKYKAGIGEILLTNSLGKQTQDLALLGLGDKADRADYRKLGASVMRSGKAANAKRIAILSHDMFFSTKENLSAFVEGLLLANYSFNPYKSKADDKKSAQDSVEVSIVSDKRLNDAAVVEAKSLSEATYLARDLVNTPANDCTPSHLVSVAKQIAKERRLQIQVFDKVKLEKLKAGSLLSVSKGSSEPPYLIKLVYKPKKKAKKIISLVGKGVTFDSGGLSIKPGPGMENMKIDMSGAAAVLGAMQAIGELKPNVEVRAYVPTTENMINGHATRPGDIVRAMNGKSIEILNTDAEGRLILADALCMATKDKCNFIVDLATLTGACMVALGPDIAGMFTRSDKLAASLKQASDVAGEKLWHMPLPKEYKELLKSPVADLKNIGGPWGGAITAALFLEEFVDDTPWAHLDIAGPAATTGNKDHITPGGVGFGVRTLVNFVRSMR